MTTVRIVCGGSETELELQGPTEIGRRGTEVELADEELSRRHLRLSPAEDGAVLIEDLESSNGTWIDGTRLSEARTLTATTVVLAGQSRITVEIEVRDDSTRLRATPPSERERDDMTRVSQTIPEGGTQVGRAPQQAPEPEPDPEPMTVRSAPSQAPPSTPPPSRRAPARQPVTAAVSSPTELPQFGAYRPASRERRTGVATRQLAPAALVFLIIAATAAALIIYFAAR